MSRLIDAEILFEKVGNIKPKNKSEYELLGKFMNMITNSPTITIPVAELDTTEDFGEWIETSNIWETEDLSGWGYWKECSSCHCQEKRRTAFCPNCGSDNRPRILDEAIDGEGKGGNVKEDEARIISNMKYYVCCPMCDKEKCVRGTEECDAEKWAKEREGDRNEY